MEVTLGDGHSLKAAGQGKVRLENGKASRCTLLDVLYYYSGLQSGKATEMERSSVLMMLAARL